MLLRFFAKTMMVRKSVYLSEINIFSNSTLVSKVFLNGIDSFLPSDSEDFGNSTLVSKVFLNAIESFLLRQ